MAEACGGACDGCAQDCASRTEPQSFLEQPHNMSSIKHIIGVASGKGGVGKSMVSALLAVTLQRRGLRVGILDADVTGPSIPSMFGVTERAVATEMGILPQPSKTGIDLISLNLLLDDASDPVVWRGPIIAGLVKQFYTDVIWHDIDYLIVDLPPGTGDVPLTIYQSLPLDGIVVVTSPQQLVSMIVEKAVRMADMMNVPVLGLVENMAYFKCPDCDKTYELFGKSVAADIAKAHDIKTVAQVPVDPKLSAAADAGTIELFDGAWLDGVADALESLDNTAAKK